MRPGTAIAAGCLVLLACLRLQEGAYTAAAVLVVLSLGALALGVWSRPTAGTASQSPAQARQARLAHERHHNGWRGIALCGMIASGVGVFVFPPMSLVLAGLSLYAVYRMRLSARSAGLAATPDTTNPR